MGNENTNKQNMLIEQPYYVDAELYGLQRKCSELTTRANSIPFGDVERESIWEQLFADFGTGNVIKEGFRCNYGFNIHIGNDCYFNFNTVILDSFPVIIHNRVFIAPNVVIAPVTHSPKADERRRLIGDKIVIEDDVWIGAGSIILPGVRLAHGSVIGAGSVVRENTEPNTLYYGTPAHPQKIIE